MATSRASGEKKDNEKKDRKRAGRNGSFDLDAFYATVDAERRARGMSWNAVAATTGVAASTLTRMAQGRSADIEALASLAIWSGVSLDAFLRPSDEGQSSPAKPTALARVAAELQRDPELGRRESLAIAEIVAVAYERLKNHS